jgi:hypothetical protein
MKIKDNKILILAMLIILRRFGIELMVMDEFNVCNINKFSNWIIIVVIVCKKERKHCYNQ